MKKTIWAAALPLIALPLIILPLSAPAIAALTQGTRAPQVVTQGALAGEDFSFNLTEALKKGPVVLYFFPKAFTQGCTLEANAFAEAMGDFKAAGATVVGLSADDVPTLKRFSTEECRDQFAVASASPATIKEYDVALVMNGSATGVSDRTSYVIAQDGTIKLAFTDLNWNQHVAKSLETVRALRQ